MSIPAVTGAGLTALEQHIGSGIVDHISRKAGHKVKPGMRVRKLSAFERLKLSMAEGTSNDSLQAKARISSGHKASARLIRLNACADPALRQQLRSRLTNSLRATDYQTTHKDELSDFEDAPTSSRVDWLRRQVFSTARFSHTLGDLCNGITSAMKEVLNNAIHPNNRKRSLDGKVKMAVGSGIASLLIGMNAKMFRTFGDMANPHRNLTVENLQQSAGLSEQQAQAVIGDVSALNGNELRQLDADQLAQTTDLSSLSADQQESLLSTLTSLNSGELLNSFYGWYWQGCAHYAMSAIARGIGRVALSGSVHATDSYIGKHLQGQKSQTLEKIFLLKEAVKECETDKYLVIKALTAKFQGLQAFTRVLSSRKDAKATASALWSLVSEARSVPELEAVFGQYMNEAGLSVREQNEREDQFIAIATLVEHFKISGNKVDDDVTGRLRVQDSTLNSLPFISGGRCKNKGVPSIRKLHLMAKLSTGRMLHAVGMCRIGNRMVTQVARKLFVINGDEKELKAAISERTRDNYSPGNLTKARSDCQVILKEKNRHNFVTVTLARISETLRFTGHHLIVSSDTNLGRVCSKAFEVACRTIFGKRASILTTRAMGMVLGVGAVGVGLSFLSMGFSAAEGFLALGGIPLGASGIKLSYASLAFGCMAFVALSVVFDLAAKASIKVFGMKPYEEPEIDISLKKLGPASLSPYQFV